MIDLFEFFVDNAGLLAEKTLAHLAISAIAIVIAITIALPVGVLLGHRTRARSWRSTSPTSCARCPASR